MIGGSVVAGAAGIAVLELDAASIGTFLLSRPFVVGPLVGWARGDAWSGAVVGVVFEAVTLAELPLGGHVQMSAAVAAGTASWLAVAVPIEAAFVAGLSAGGVHAWLERRLRLSRGESARQAEESLRAGRPAALGAKIISSLIAQAAATFAVSLLFLGVCAEALPWLWRVLPEFAVAGARAAFLCAPWIGAGGLVASLGRRA